MGCLTTRNRTGEEGIRDYASGAVNLQFGEGFIVKNMLSGNHNLIKGRLKKGKEKKGVYVVAGLFTQKLIGTKQAVSPVV